GQPFEPRFNEAHESALVRRGDQVDYQRRLQIGRLPAAKTRARDPLPWWFDDFASLAGAPNCMSRCDRAFEAGSGLSTRPGFVQSGGLQTDYGSHGNIGF